MKMTTWVTMILLTAVLALTGCGKSKTPPPPQVSGVTIDLPKLRQEFATANAEQQSILSQVLANVRYSDYSAALAGLNKLANSPGITESQKKVVNDVTEQVKQVASKPAGQPTQ